MSLDFSIEDLFQIGEYLRIPRGEDDNQYCLKVMQVLVEKMKTPGDEFFGCWTPMAVKMRFKLLRNK